MSYRDPRCVMVADSLGEADVVATFLDGQGIRAEVMDRNTRGGFEGLSLLSPQGVSSRGIEVWVLDPAQVPQAIELLAEQEMQRTTRNAVREVGGDPVEVVCEECGTATTFPPEQIGTVQDCPSCAAYLDVGGDEEEFEDETDNASGDGAPRSEGIQHPPHIRPESAD